MPADYQQPPADIQPAAPSPSFDEQYKQARDLANSGQPALALAAYDALLARSPGNADVLLGRGIAFTRLERWSEAEADLRAAAASSPAYADVWSALGNLYQWSGRPEQAAEAYARAIALQPDAPDAYMARARALRAASRAADARADLARARSLGFDAGEVDAMLAAMRPRPGTPDAAIAEGYAWAAGLSSTWTRLGDNPRWNEQTASIRHYGKLGSIGFEALRAQRFAQTGHAWALDAYTKLWNGAYANLRYQRAPSARLFPANSGRIELYQAVGDGWEVSLSDDVLGFGERVNIYGVSLAKYSGNWYVQLRHQNIVAPGSHGSGDRLLGRYYYQGDADSYLELAVNRGRSDDPLSLAGGRTRSGGGSVNLVHYFSRDWGGRVGAAFSRDSGGSARERSLNFAVYRRW
ncbi:YaiO family outer membrane beta-barrel protein [Massilia sp. ZL223]|uniref:YaiO family outer membrane beta-barrel protein n=3 Tax=unclassified Massilia TaxID=2609279 RepID=UPI001B80F850|nr:YaiO family outer membrane beta-barrel protein [Massilia sp. ZL223]MBQ5962799.1 YaiO family outer membrane beta-barrel protein [Massilia sp. ZL223]